MVLQLEGEKITSATHSYSLQRPFILFYIFLNDASTPTNKVGSFLNSIKQLKRCWLGNQTVLLPLKKGNGYRNKSTCIETLLACQKTFGYSKYLENKNDPSI
tara:strand:- start:693 stop:998 length:306 start_codon:yes stop_codon:yes gene_type:complete